MSFPFTKCDNDECKYCKYDPDYQNRICNYHNDIELALSDEAIPRDCPWTKEERGDRRQAAEVIALELIGELKDRADLSSAHPVKVSTLKGMILFMENNWTALMKEIEQGLEV